MPLHRLHNYPNQHDTSYNLSNYIAYPDTSLDLYDIQPHHGYATSNHFTQHFKLHGSSQHFQWHPAIPQLHNPITSQHTATSPTTSHIKILHLILVTSHYLQPQHYTILANTSTTQPHHNLTSQTTPFTDYNTAHSQHHSSINFTTV